MLHPISKGIIAILIGVVPAGVIGTQVASATPLQHSVVAAPQPTTQGIIMSDGRICNPRWGC